MTRDDMLAQISIVLDRAWEAGWDAGYGEGVVVGQEEVRSGLAS